MDVRIRTRTPPQHDSLTQPHPISLPLQAPNRRWLLLYNHLRPSFIQHSFALPNCYHLKTASSVTGPLRRSHPINSLVVSERCTFSSPCRTMGASLRYGCMPSAVEVRHQHTHGFSSCQVAPESAASPCERWSPSAAAPDSNCGHRPLYFHSPSLLLLNVRGRASHFRLS